MSDMREVIVPKSDQLNSDDLIAGPMTIKVTGVSIRGGQEQPVAISFEGDNGKPYKACKSMCRVLVTAWGADSKRYVGRSMTLYRDPSVKWGGMEVGGIRISHMSDIESPLTMALTATKGSRKPYVVKPLVAPVPVAVITAEQVAQLETRCQDANIPLAELRDVADVQSLAEMPAKRFRSAMKWIDERIAEQQPA